MNIVEAWNALKNGKDVFRPQHDMTADFWKHETFKSFVANLNEESAVAVDWCAKKRERIEEMTMGELRKRNGVHVVEPAGPVSTHIPNRAIVTIRWDE